MPMLHQTDKMNAGTGCRPALVASGMAPAPLWAPAGRCDQTRRFNLPAAIVIVLLHIVALAALVMFKNHVVHKRETRLTVFDVAPTPPPQPAAEGAPEQAEMAERPVVAPQPVVQLPPRPVLAVPTMSEPVPQPMAAAPNAAPSAPPNIIQASDLGTRMVAGKPPHYPIESRRKKEQGAVVLSLVLGVDGAVSSISIVQSSGFARLDGAALDAVRRWLWEPTMRGGQPVMVRGVVEIPFILEA